MNSIEADRLLDLPESIPTGARTNSAAGYFERTPEDNFLDAKITEQAADKFLDSESPDGAAEVAEIPKPPSQEELSSLDNSIRRMTEENRASLGKYQTGLPRTFGPISVDPNPEYTRRSNLLQLASDYTTFAGADDGILGGLNKATSGEGGRGKALPFIGSIMSADAKELRNELLKKLQNEEYLDESERIAIDAMGLARRRAQQNPKFWEQVGELVGGSIPYALEFALTGGVYSGARAATAAALKQAPKVVQAVAPRALGVAAQTAAAAPARTVDSYLDRVAPQWGVEPQSLRVVINDEQEDKNVAAELAKAAGGQYVEYLSERTGRLIGKAIPKASIIKLLRLGALQKWMQRTGSKLPISQAYKQMRKATKFDGVPEEVLEEYVAAGLNSLGGIDEQNNVPGELAKGDVAGALGAFVNSLPFKETPAMAVSFGLIPASQAALTSPFTISRGRERKKRLIALNEYRKSQERQVDLYNIQQEKMVPELAEEIFRYGQEREAKGASIKPTTTEVGVRGEGGEVGTPPSLRQPGATAKTGAEAPDEAKPKAQTDPEAIAAELGLTFKAGRQRGAIRMEGLSPEELAALEAKQPEQWEFTDNRPDSPTPGLTFYVPVGSGDSDIVRAYNKKLIELAKARNVEPNQKTDVVLEGSGTRRVKNEEVALRPELMQFKRADDPETGESEAAKISGKWNETFAGRLIVWEPKNPAEYGLTGNQKYIVANGHHRVAFGKRQGVSGFDAQVLRESEGYSAQDARRIGAEANIVEGKGTIYDQVKFLRNAGRPRSADEALEIRRRLGAEGRKATDIAFNAADVPDDSPNSLYGNFINERITPDAAHIIATTAPGDAELQGFGITRALAGDTPGAIRARMEVRRVRAKGQVQTDLFGNPIFSDTNEGKQADKVAMIRRDLSDRIALLKRAGKDPKVAKQEGIDIRNPEALPTRINELQALLDRWNGEWWLSKDLVQQLAEPTEKPKGGDSNVVPEQPKKEVPKKEAVEDKPPKIPEPVQPEPFRALTKEDQERLAQIRKRLRDKFKGERFAGPIDDETLKLGAEYVYIYSRAGVRKFADIVKRFKAELPDIFNAVKDHIRSFVERAAVQNPALEEVSRADAKRIIDEITSGKPDQPVGDLKAKHEKLLEPLKAYFAKKAPTTKSFRNATYQNPEFAVPARMAFFIALRHPEKGWSDLDYGMMEEIRDWLISPEGRKEWSDFTGSERFEEGKQVTQVSADSWLSSAKRWVRRLEKTRVLKFEAGQELLSDQPELFKWRGPVNVFAEEKSPVIEVPELEKMLAEPPADADPLIVTAWAIGELAYATGFRPVAISNLTLDHLDLDAGLLKGKIGLGEKTGVKGVDAQVLTDSAIHALRRYLKEARPKRDGASGKYLFPAPSEPSGLRAMPVSTITSYLKKLADFNGASNIKGKLPGTQAMRGTLITHLSDMGVPLKEINEIVPHADKSESRVLKKSYLSPTTQWLATVGQKVKQLPHNQAFLERRKGAAGPKLRPGEKGTGDLLQGDAPFNLAGEQGVDAERIAREKAEAERRAKEAKELQDKQQQNLFGEEGGSPRQASLPKNLPSNKFIGRSGIVATYVKAPDGRQFRELSVDNPDDLELLLDAPNLTLRDETRQALRGILRLQRRAKGLPGLTLAISEYLHGGVEGEYWPDQRLIRFLQWAEADTPIHEFLHHLFAYLRQEDRDYIRSLRIATIRKMLSQARNYAEIPQLEAMLKQQMTSDEFMEKKYFSSVYHLSNETEFFVWLMSKNAQTDFMQPERRSFIRYIRDLIGKLYYHIKQQLGLTSKQEELWRQIITGDYEFDPRQAINRSRGKPRELMLPQEPSQFITDRDAAQISYASLEIPRIARSLIDDRRAAQGRLDAIEYDTERYRAAKEYIDDKVTKALQAAANTGNPSWDIPENVPRATDEDLADKLRTLGIEFSPQALEEAQKDIAFEQEAAKQNRRRKMLEKIKGMIDMLAGPMLNLKPQDYAELTQTAERLEKAILKVEANTDTDNALGITIDERARQIEEAELTEIDDRARADSLIMPFVRETFVNPLESGDQMFDRFQRTLGAFKAAIDNPSISEAHKRAIANETIKQILDFQINQEKFEKYHDARIAMLAKRMRDIERSLTDSKMGSGFAEILIDDALKTAKGERGLTGTFEGREAVEFLQDSYGTIIAFANNLRQKYPNDTAQGLLLRILGGLSSATPGTFEQERGFGTGESAQAKAVTVSDWLKVLQSQKPDQDIADLKEAAKISNEALARILFVLKTSKPFEDAVSAMLRFANKKLAKDPTRRLDEIGRLLDSGDKYKVAEAQGKLEKLLKEAREDKEAMDALIRSKSKELKAVQIELGALKYAKELFDAVTGTEETPNREFLDIKRTAEEKLNWRERMILSVGNTEHRLGGATIVFRGGFYDREDLKIEAKDAVLLREEHLKKIQDWYRDAERYIDEFAEQDYAWRNDSTGQTKSPEEMGMDRAIYRGLREALERKGAFLAPSTIHMGTRTVNNMAVQWLLTTKLFRQYLMAGKQLRGLFGRKALSDIVRYGNTLGDVNAVFAEFNIKIAEARTAALKSHPEFDGDLERYSVEVFNQMASEGRKFGSTLRVGMKLPVYGREVTQADMDFLREQRNLNDALRQAVTERQGRGILHKTGSLVTKDYRVFVREAASVGDFGLPMIIKQRGSDLIRDIQSAYGIGKNEWPKESSDLGPNSRNKVVQFWNAHPESLIRHILDAGRAFRAITQKPDMVRAEQAAAAELSENNDPLAIRTLEDAVTLIAKNYLANTGRDVRSYVAGELLAELQQYFAHAASDSPQLDMLQETEGGGGVTLRSEFTTPAARFLFPSDWYDYGIITNFDERMLTGRVMHEPIIEMQSALKQVSAAITAEIKASAGKPYTNYRSIHHALRIQRAVDDLLADLNQTWFVEPERGLPDFPPSVIKDSLLASVTVNIRNIWSGAMMAFNTIARLHRFSQILAAIQSLKHAALISLKVPLDVMFSKNYPLGRQMYKIMRGPLANAYPSLVNWFMDRIVDSHRIDVDAVQNLGFSNRDPYIRSMKQMWRDIGTFQSTEAKEKQIPLLSKPLRVGGNVTRMVSHAYRLVGSQAFDKIINAHSLAFVGNVLDTLRDVAMVYGAQREGLGEYDPLDKRWQVKPGEFSGRLTKMGRRKNLADFQEFLLGADLNIEDILWKYYKQVRANEKAKADAKARGEPIDPDWDKAPSMLTDEQLAALRRATLREFNAGDALNRPVQLTTNRLFRMLATFHGWSSNFMLQFLSSFDTARNAKTAERYAVVLPTLIGIAFANAVLILSGAALVDLYRRKFQGATQRQATLFSKEFWNDRNKMADAIITAQFASLPYIGDLVLFARDTVMNNRGYDPAGRVLSLSILTQLFNTMRGMWNMRSDPQNMINPLRDFVFRFAGLTKELAVATSSAYGSAKDYKGGVGAISYGAQQAGYSATSSSNARSSSPDYGPTSGIREDLMSAMIEQNAEALQKNYQKLVDYYAKKGLEKPEQAAKRDIVSMNPVLRGFGGKKPTAEQYEQVYRGLSANQRASADKSMAGWQWAANELGITYDPAKTERYAGNRASYSSSASLPPSRRLSLRGSSPSRLRFRGTASHRTLLGRRRSRRLRYQSRSPYRGFRGYGRPRRPRLRLYA